MSESTESTVNTPPEGELCALSARGLCKHYDGPAGPVHVLNGVDLDVPRGTLLAITGASGAGKTTLLNILGALDHASSGEVQIGPLRVDSLGERERCRLRAERLGFVFQFHHLLPEFTAEENVMMPLRIAGRTVEESRARAREVLDAVGLGARLGHVPAELSGGEAQRVAVARALACSPELVLADEPSGNLDSATAQELHELLASLARNRHQTFVVATHNDKLAALADRVLRLEAGRLVPVRE